MALLKDGDYVAKFWQIAFEDRPLEVAAVVRKPRGTAEWRVTGRFRVRRDDLYGSDSRDVKHWFESPPLATEEEAIAAWHLHLKGFMAESNLVFLEAHEIDLHSSSEKDIVARLSQEKFSHQGSPPSEKVTGVGVAPGASPALLN